jgi:hypothetical protein
MKIPNFQVHEMKKVFFTEENYCHMSAKYCRISSFARGETTKQFSVRWRLLHTCQRNEVILVDGHHKIIHKKKWKITDFF